MFPAMPAHIGCNVGLYEHNLTNSTDVVLTVRLAKDVMEATLGF